MRKKRNSVVLEKADQRASAISSIQADLDLGNGLTLEAYRAAIDSVREKQQHYNAMLSSVDQLYSQLEDEERALREMSEHMLSGVKARFGRDSYEYEMAGGVRHSERKRPQRKPKAVAAS
ncbi:hypothetical protein C7271_13705 [filamentous cyanobacterium CCP5]|nr:hypothetical protein C7271_13705 [filamentous cyanobacterium CCP5]